MNFKAHIITSESCEGKVTKAWGYGENAHEMKISTKGTIMNFRITLNGESQFGIHINEHGRLIITDYGSMCFEAAVPNNFTLEPRRKWKK